MIDTNGENKTPEVHNIAISYDTISNRNQYKDPTVFDGKIYANCDFVNCSFKTIEFSNFINCTFTDCTFNKNDANMTRQLSNAIINKKVQIKNCDYDVTLVLENTFKTCDYRGAKIDDLINRVASKENIQFLKGVTVYAL